MNIYYLYDEEKERYSEIDVSVDDFIVNADVTEIDKDRIKELLVVYNEGTEIHMMLADYKNGVIYYGDGVCLHDLRKADKKEFSQENQKTISRILTDNRVYDWQTKYITENNGTNAWSSWTIGIKDENQHVVLFSGSGVTTKGYPKGYYDVFQSLFSLVYDF